MQSYVERKVAAAQDMIKDMYLPYLEACDIEFSVNVHVVEGPRSAAGIAEQVVQAATEAGSDLLAVTSHGGYATLSLYWRFAFPLPSVGPIFSRWQHRHATIAYSGGPQVLEQSLRQPGIL